MGDEERQKKLEAGKAKLAQFRQRKAQSDGQSASKKQKKKKKASNTKDEESMQDWSQRDETSKHGTQRGAAATPDFAIMRTLRSGEIIKHDQKYTIEPDSEICTTADDYSSEVNGCSFVARTAIPADLIREEEFGVGATYSEHETQQSQTRLEMMENELAGKQQEIEELNRELEEMRAAYGTEGLQQLQEFEAAIKQRDDIITQLTTNLQQARKEKDETLREFLELTEQSQKLQIQFQHLQASEALRNTSHSSTATDLLHAKQQILTHQQQLEEQEYLLKNYQKKHEEFEAQITLLQENIAVYEVEKHKNESEDSNKKLQEKEALIGELKAKIIEEEKNAFQMKEKLSDANKSLDELKEQIIQRNQEANNVRLELVNCKQKERQCSDEIKQLMGTVEELQKRCHKDSQFEADIVQRMELETQRKLAQLQAELDELYGQQIVQMKQELIKQHALEIEELRTQQKIELEKNLNPRSTDNINEDEVHLMNIKINELTVKLKDANFQKEKIKQDLSQQLEEISAEKSLQQTQIEDLFQELTFAREQIQRAKQTIVDQDCKLNEASKYQVIIEDLKAQLASASELRKELELGHEAEVTNYKIKLEMLEREKDEVLDRMAESQEAELERLRTQLLFSHEEELSKLREDLQQEHRINIENLKDNLAAHYKEQLEVVQNEMSQKMEAMQFEKDNLITKQSQLILEISNLKDLQQSVVISKSEEMSLHIQELQKEIDVLRQEEIEKGTLEQEVQELQLKTELLEKQMKEKEDSLQEKCTTLETENNLLKDENRALEEKLKHVTVSSGEKMIFTDRVSTNPDLDVQRKLEKLMAENEKLIKQNIELEAEIERQKNTFSFAEKNFEATYQELQKEYASLLKVKADLEESKKKEEAEYKTKLKALTEELQHLQSYKLVVMKNKSAVFEGSEEDKICRAETFEVGEVVEKDTTELMEKLEVAQREKVELSLRLSDLSEQLNLKHNELCQLSDEVKSLKQEKEQVLARCKELEFIISHNQTENVNIFEQKAKYSKEKTQTDAGLVSDAKNIIISPNREHCEEIKVREDNMSLCKDSDNSITEKEIQQMLNPEQQSLLDHLHQITDKLTGETSLLANTQHENGQLQQQLDRLKSEQADLRLQMEAQRICLSLVYSAHVDQVRECLKAEKEHALCSLKEELICSHTQEMNELKKMHQLELQTLRGQQTDDEEKSTLMLIEKLSKAVSEECCRLTQLPCIVQSEQHSTSVKVSTGEQNVFHASALERNEPNVELPTDKIQAQALQESMQALLSKIMEEYNRLMLLHAQFMRDFKKVEEQQMSYGELEQRTEEESSCLQVKIEDFQTPSQDLSDLMVRASHWEEMKNLKTHLEGQHAQEIEHLRSYFQQQLRETEERYTTEIVHLQNSLQDVSESPEHFSIPAESQENPKDIIQKMTQTESLDQQSTEREVEFPSEVESKGDMDIIQLLEKQYQERLEEEIAKVIVSMSVAFAQQTELERMSKQKEESAESVAQTQFVHQKEKHFESRKKCTEAELHDYLSKGKNADIKHSEEVKPLSKELSEESCEISSVEEQLESSVKPGHMLELSKHEMRSPVQPFSHDKDHTITEISPYQEMAASSTETPGQLLLYEERLEDMRQELVRQYQEHQQATELLRRGHMQQMERQKENQELLLAELDRLKVQLAESVSVDNDILVMERERMLLEELELLKQQSVPGREKQHCELCNNSTQTQNENESQIKSKEYTFESEDGGGKPEEISSDSLSKERHALQKTNSRLLKILLEVVKTTVAVEETIGQHVLGLLDRSGKDPPPSKTVLWEMEAEQSLKSYVHVGLEKEEPSSSCHGTDLGSEAINWWPGVTEEGLQLIQHLTESSFPGAEIDPDKEELVLNISSRLQAAVEKLLEAINETSNQLEHAKVTQTELMRESFKKQQEATEFFKCQEELQERLNEEVRVREQLALELSKAEGLIDSYADEKAFLEKQIQEKTDIIDHLEQELLCTGNKLQELEAEQQQIQEEKELLSRQKSAMIADAGPVEQRIVDAAVDAASQAELLEETEKLMKEKIEVQRQAEKEYDDLQKQVKALETDVEEQVNRFVELEQEKNAEIMDLRQQNQALEKQLEKTRKFLDEQAIDREHERDVFQQEIQKLEQQLKTPQRFQPINEHQTREVEQLTNHLQEKTDKCSELLLSKEQLQRDIQERNEEIEKLECRIRELEQALIISADNLQKVEERKQCGVASAVKGELPLEAQLQAEREAVDRKEKEITNLEEQLEQFREELENKNEEVQQLHMQLEIQRKESTTCLQELEQENKLFKDEMERLGLVIQKSEDASIKDRYLIAGKLAQIMQEKEQEIDHLNEQITTLQQQLEITTDNKVIEEKNEHIKELEAQIEYLKSDQERVKKNSEEEIEQLNEVIEKLQQELANIEHKVPVDVASIQEDADSLKYQLDTVLAEKEALEKQMEDDNVKASLTKNELEETKFKMNHLKKELDTLKREHEKVTEKYKHLLMDSDKAEEGDRSKDKSEKEEALIEKTAELLENKIQLKSVEENTKITISTMEIKLKQLQAAVQERDSELCQCYNQMKDLKEQAKVETQILKKKILDLEEILQEKVAAALVSQVQLNAVQEQTKLRQSTKRFSNEEANKSTQTENANPIAKQETESKLSVLTEKLSEMENELAKMYRNLEVEKENAEIAQKEATQKENRLLELQQLLEDIQEKHKEEIKKTPEQEEVQTSEVVIELTQGQEGCILITERELEKIKAESAAAKEELNSYREKSEKLQEELVVRETSMTHLQEELRRVKDNLIEAEKKIADCMRKEEKIAALEGRKDVDKPDVSTKEEPTFIRKSSSSQTDKTVQINSSNQTLQVVVKNAEVQNDLQNESLSEEVAEVIREFTEKIDQMQELHAAEIMDMETRHISESEALKREQFVAVQVLTDECNALKEVIESLRDKEAVPISGLPHTGSYQAREGCSSDSSSDWSQGIYLTQSQGSDTVSEGVGEEDETSSDLLPKKIKGLLRAVHHEGVQVLSLTEFPDSERDIISLKQGPESWLEERKSLLSTISSLKDLITQMQLHRESEIYANCESPESVPDWRGELLHAVQQVFLTEQDVLLAAFQTELAELGTKDAVVLMNQLEHRLQEQVINQRMAMDFIQSADRKSLLMEIQVLHAQMNNRKINPKREQEIDPKNQGALHEMLEYNMQQKQSQILEMQVELRSVKDRAAELQEQLNSERMMVSELKNELAQAKLELETTLKAQHKHFKDLETIRTEVKEKAAELDMLKDTMANEQKKSRELQWALEKEKNKMERTKERGREELEDLKFSLEDQKQKNLQLTKLLEQEKQLSNDLHEKIESQEILNAAQLSHERARNSELQVLLESEKVRALEMSSALEREKELCAQLQGVEKKEKDGTPKTTEELLKDLQKQMDEKHDRIVDLVSEMEGYKLESVQLRQQMEKERQIQKKTLQTECDANILAQKKVHELESKVKDLHGQLGEKRQQVHKLQHEAKKLQEIIQELQRKEQERETTWDTSSERTRNWVLQQKMEGAEINESTDPTLSEVKGGDLGEGNKVLESVRQKLENVSSKLKQLAHKATSRLLFETADDEDFIGVQNNIEDVLSLLRTLPGLSQLEELKLALSPGTSSSSLTEGLLRRNAELMGFVSRLSEEKNNLRNTVMKLEEELRRYRQRGPCGDYSSRYSLDSGANIDTLLGSEREIWNREKLFLQKSLKQADAEVSKLRAEIRSEAFLRELGSHSENAVLKIIYGKFLRAESFRKALIYQKKYLLLLVGGFQECEEATLALIARMGGQPSYVDLEFITHRSKGFTRFRSVVRVSIAISRMKFLVRRWHRVTGSNLISVSRDGFSQNTVNELRSDSLAGGLELCGEHRPSSDRSRSDLESLRSPVNFQHKYQGSHADLSPASLAYSQLHNYDPDRALTDYINRLEALQRRLGSVQSGSASYTYLHSGVRR